MDVGLGRPADHELSAWEQMFVPMHLRDYVQQLQVRDPVTGATKPLVISERELLVSRTHRDPAKPPNYIVGFLLIGIAIGVMFLVLGGAIGRDARGARTVAAILMGVWCFIAGVLGLLLTLLWTVTNHRFAYYNENLLLFNPIWLVLLVLVPMRLTRARARDSRSAVVRWTNALVTIVAALSGVALLLHIIMLSRQDNLAIIGLALPPALALAWVLPRAGARSR
jgi:hypothetical protein